jgi:hypothetical protein
MKRSLFVLSLAVGLSLVGCAAGSDDATEPASTEAAVRGTSWRKLPLSAQVKATLSACNDATRDVGDYFLCPTIDRYGMNGPITDAVLARFAEKRSAEVYVANATKEQAIDLLWSRARGQLASVDDAATQAKLDASMQRIQTLLENTPGTRFVLADGYWAPSVNSASVYVIDDSDNTLFVFEHGDTDG